MESKLLLLNNLNKANDIACSSVNKIHNVGRVHRTRALFSFGNINSAFLVSRRLSMYLHIDVTIYLIA